MPGVVDQYVEPAVLRDDGGDGRQRRCVGLDVKLDRSKIYLMLSCIGCDFGCLLGILAVQPAHGRVDRMP
jgi:hypothetical protein